MVARKKKHKNWGKVSAHKRHAKWSGNKLSKVHAHERRVNPSHKELDEHKARELYLSATNDYRITRMYEAIKTNLAKKMAKGTYSIPLAVKGWGYYIKAAADLYKKDFGDTFGKAERDYASALVEANERHGVQELAKEFVSKRKNPAPSSYKRIERLRKLAHSLRGKPGHERALDLLRLHRGKAWRSTARPTSKTNLVYVVQGYYGGRWEDVAASLNPHEAKQNYVDYCRNERQYSHRLISRREKK